MDKITIGLLTISDRCSKKEAVDESGSCLMTMINSGVIKDGEITKAAVVPDKKTCIQEILMDWCLEGINLILTTGGTGISPTDVTPEATSELLDKTIFGISSLLLNRSLDVTPFAALSRGVAGVIKKTLIINLPGSKKASKECLEAVACVIPHAVDLITEKKKKVEQTHDALQGKKSLVIPGNLGNRKRVSPYPLVSVSEAQNIVTERVFLLVKEKMVGYEEAAGYVLAQDVAAQDNLPPFDVSLKDGYAVLSSCSDYYRNLIGVSVPGNSLLNINFTLDSCVRISTGAAIPIGANAVVQVEDTIANIDAEGQENKIKLKLLPRKGQDIRPLGSDFKLGERVLSTKTYVDAAAVGLLAAAGVTSVKVYEKPLVGVLSTGDEIVPPNEKPTAGKTRDSNRITLINLLSEENFKTVDLGIAPDEPDALRDSLERGFRMADVVVTTGSMSMGERDYLKEVLIADFNAEICFGRVLMKPGKPTAFAVLSFENRPKLWFGFPGNPASAFVASHLFLLPSLRRISGYEKVFPISFNAVCKNKITQEDRPQYVRGFLTFDEKEQKWHASFKPKQSSSRIESCVNTNCLIKINTTNDESLSFPTVKAFLIGKLFGA